MKRMNQWLAVGLVAALSACAIQRGPLALPTIGPAPVETSAGKGLGNLVVFTAWVVDRSFDRHTGYILISDDGKLDKPIRNQADAFDQRPAVVVLPPGKYQVIAPSENYGRIKVPVLIEEGRTTFIYLDSSSQPRVAKSEMNKLVKMPDGSIAGWAADAGGN
jgi:hypothetical protein